MCVEKPGNGRMDAKLVRSVRPVEIGSNFWKQGGTARIAIGQQFREPPGFDPRIVAEVGHPLVGEQCVEMAIKLAGLFGREFTIVEEKVGHAPGCRSSSSS